MEIENPDHETLAEKYNPMKELIERVMFSFKDGQQVLNNLNDRFFSLDNLLTRLLNEKYQGKKIKFINIIFSTDKTYELYPQSPKYYTHFHSGHLWYNAVFDLVHFESLNDYEQRKFIWEAGCNNLKEASTACKNISLFEACDYAYNKGIEINLNPNFKLIETTGIINESAVKAAIWIIFGQDGMKSKVTLEKNGTIIFEKEIDKTKNGVEFFLDMYKKIEIRNNAITINGHRDVEYLPLTISFSSLSQA